MDRPHSFLTLVFSKAASAAFFMPGSGPGSVRFAQRTALVEPHYLAYEEVLSAAPCEARRNRRSAIRLR